MAGGLFVVGALPLAVAGAGALACFGAYELIKRKKNLNFTNNKTT